MIEARLQWSPEVSVPAYLRDALPEVVHLPFVSEGMVLDLRRDDETGYTLFSADVDYIRVNAEDPVNVEITLYVLHG